MTSTSVGSEPLNTVGHRTFIRGVGVLGLTEALLRLRGLVLIPVLTKYYGAFDYGVWAQVTVLATALYPVVALTSDASLLRFLPGSSRDVIRRGFSAVMLLVAIAAVLTVAALTLGARPLAVVFFGGAENARFVQLCGWTVLAAVLTNSCRAFLRVIGRPGAYGTVNIIQSAYTAIIPVALMIAHRDLYAIVFWSVIADLVLAGLLIAVIGLTYGLCLPDREQILQFLRFGLPLLPAGYAVWALNASCLLYTSPSPRD